MTQTNDNRLIPGFEGIYSVSRDGKVYSHKRGRYLKPHITHGYHKIYLSKNGIAKQYAVHRLVWFAFVGVVPKHIGIDHIDGNPQNNNLENLRPCNQNQNNANSLGRPNKRVSKYKGVLPTTSSKKNPWRSNISYNRVKVHLGNFLTEEEAALAYNDAAIQLYGEYALTNKIRTA